MSFSMAKSSAARSAPVCPPETIVVVRRSITKRLRLQPFWHPFRKFFGDDLLDVGHAILRFGVRAEKLGWRLTGTGSVEDFHHADHCPRVVAGQGRQPYAPLVRLQFFL